MSDASDVSDAVFRRTEEKCRGQKGVIFGWSVQMKPHDYANYGKLERATSVN